MRARKPLNIFFAVERALFLREIEKKISIGRSGLVWTFLEPFLQVFILVMIRSAIVEARGGVNAGSNYDIVIFMASGFIGFNIFRHVLSFSTGAFSANKALFVYKQVKPFDTLFARMLTEVFLSSVVVLIFIFLGFMVGYDNFLPKNSLMVTLAFLWLIVFSFSWGMLVSIGNFFFVSIGKTVGLFSFGLMIFSAVFYPLVALPVAAQEILLYNPLVHFMEMIHGNYLYELDDRFVNYTYMFYWTIVPLFMGLWLYEKLEKRIISE